MAGLFSLLAVAKASSKELAHLIGPDGPFRPQDMRPTTASDTMQDKTIQVFIIASFLNG
jgi:hypothetical protein